MKNGFANPPQNAKAGFDHVVEGEPIYLENLGRQATGDGPTNNSTDPREEKAFAKIHHALKNL